LISSSQLISKRGKMTEKPVESDKPGEPEATSLSPEERGKLEEY
jgi:hypothetical protein